MQGFLDLASYYRRFVKGFSKIGAPLIASLRRKCDYVNWKSNCDSRFLNLKIVLTPTHVLTIIDHLKEGIDSCIDINILAIGVVLIQ